MITTYPIGNFVKLEFKVVSTTNIATLEKFVQEHLDKGWKFHGQIFVTSGTSECYKTQFHQAFTKTGEAE